MGYSSSKKDRQRKGGEKESGRMLLKVEEELDTLVRGVVAETGGGHQLQARDVEEQDMGHVTCKGIQAGLKSHTVVILFRTEDWPGKKRKGLGAENNGIIEYVTGNSQRMGRGVNPH